jgi:hypothetical protein
MAVRNKEQYRTGRIGWLRARVLGANDGILSTWLPGVRVCPITGTEQADLAVERGELRADDEGEHQELMLRDAGLVRRRSSPSRSRAVGIRRSRGSGAV